MITGITHHVYLRERLPRAQGFEALGVECIRHFKSHVGVLLARHLQNAIIGQGSEMLDDYQRTIAVVHTICNTARASARPCATCNGTAVRTRQT